MCDSHGASGAGFPLREYYCESGYFLRIQADGGVSGVERSGDENAVFEVSSVTHGVVALKAVHSGLYLAVDDKGQAHGQADLDSSCELVEKLDPSGRYTVFQPRRFSAHGWHLALSRQGRARPAHKVDADQKCAWFLPRTTESPGTDGSGGKRGQGDGGASERRDGGGTVTPTAGRGAGGFDLADVDSDFLEKLGFTAATGLGTSN